MGWSSKYSSPIWSPRILREDWGLLQDGEEVREEAWGSRRYVRTWGGFEFNKRMVGRVLGRTFWIGVAVDWFVWFVLSWVVWVGLFRCMVAWFDLVGFLLALRSASTTQWLQWRLGLLLVTDAWGNPPWLFHWGGSCYPKWPQLRRKRVMYYCTKGDLSIFIFLGIHVIVHHCSMWVVWPARLLGGEFPQRSSYSDPLGYELLLGGGFK